MADDIPKHIERRAFKMAIDYRTSELRDGVQALALTNVIAGAILAAMAEEREACALIAANMSNPYTGGARGVAGEHGQAIADAIRQGGEA